jgi:hypothetical protein
MLKTGKSVRLQVPKNNGCGLCDIACICVGVISIACGVVVCTYSSAAFASFTFNDKMYKIIIAPQIITSYLFLLMNSRIFFRPLLFP